MSNLFVPQVGAVMSTDIAVPEHARELRFYQQVLTTGKQPLWGKHGLNNIGIPIVGLGAHTAEHDQLPLQWTPHIQVADVAASAQRALDLGGSELMHAKDGSGGSQWAVLSDPNRAAFGIIPVVPADSISPNARTASADAPIGRIQWLDLTVTNAEATRDFYQQVVGWSVEEVAMADEGGSYADYQMLLADGTPSAGICHARGVNVGLPPVWMIYLTVGDLAESLRRVPEAGGTVLKTMPGEHGGYSYGAIQDPVGACLALVQG